MEEKTKLPVIWPGYIILAISFIVEIFADLRVSPGGLLCGIYWLCCVHRIHVVLAEITNGSYPITPGKSVWYNFIPFFNLYWIFKWTNEMEKFVSSRLRPPGQMNGIASGIFLLIGGIVGRVLGGVFGMAIMLGVLSYINSRIKPVIETTPVEVRPDQEKAQSYYF